MIFRKKCKNFEKQVPSNTNSFDRFFGETNSKRHFTYDETHFQEIFFLKYIIIADLTIIHKELSKIQSDL